jgi:hypothetical protein
MNKIHLPSLQIPNSTCACLFDRNRSSEKSNSSVWHRLYQTATGSSYRHSCYYNEIDSPKNDLDFRLRTCYDHAQETFASKARIVIQPMTIFQFQKFNKIISISPNSLASPQTTNYPFKIINKNRKKHFNESTKCQHITSDHFANGRHGYSRVLGGTIPID